MARRPLQRKNTEVDIFDDVDLDCAKSMLSDATGDTINIAQEPVSSRSGVLGSELRKGPLDEGEATIAVESEIHGQSDSDADPAAMAAEPTNVLLKFRVRQETRTRFDSFKAQLSAALGGTRLTDANIGRALLDWILFEVSEDILTEASDQPAPRRPPSDDLVAMASFDESLRDILRRGVRKRMS